MTTASTDSTPAVRTTPVETRRWRLSETMQTVLLLLPSIVALAVFVYVFISFTFWVSLSNWRTLKIDLTLREPLFATYVEMFAMARWQADLRNTFVFTIFFIAFAVTLGLTLAILLDREGKGMNLKKVYRLYKEERLTVRRRGGLHAGLAVALVVVPGHDEAVAELNACAGIQFDPRAVEGFLA